MMKLRVLVACEESQAVTKEFRRLGHEAFSCDLLPCSGGHPEWHVRADIFELAGAIKFYTEDLKDHLISDWDLVISFQPCTDLTVSGARWFPGKRESGSQEASIRFFLEVWKFSNCSENPIGIINGGNYIKKWFPELFIEMQDAGFPFSPSQIIQPWQFGHGETKSTCLWLNGLPDLIPTEIVSGREQRVWKMPPGPDRAKLRSKTFPGIATAMAEQWSEYIIRQKQKSA